jgi:hypothetical protein
VIDVTRQDTNHGLLQVVSGGEGVYLSQLPPRTTLLVRTLNSLYRIVTTSGTEVCIRGGEFFPDPTAAWVVGSSRVPGRLLKVGWIGIGLRIELRSGDQYVETSAVHAITAEPLAD